MFVQLDLPPPTSNPKVTPRLVDWALFGLRCGAVLGAGLGLAGTLANACLHEGSGSARPSFFLATSALLLSTLVAALGMCVLALVTWPLLRWRAGRAFALGLQATVAALFAAGHLTSNALHALSGSYLTLGALEFMQAGGPHLIRTIVVGYTRWVLTLGACSVFIGVALILRGRRQLSTPSVAAAKATRWIPVGLAGAALVPIHLIPGIAQASPELALADSMDPDPVEPEIPAQPEELPGARAVARPTVVDGPEQSSGDRWKETVHALSQRRTNVLLVTLESISIEHLGYYGYERDTTPNLDRIARQSWRMRRAWTTATHSNYAQMAILSSLFPRRTAGLDVYKRLDYPRVLLHDAFHELGYSTGTISSQDETWQGMLRFQQTGTPTFYRYSKDYGGFRQDIGSELVVLDHVTVDVATDWIRRQGDHPWSLYVNFQATHFPYKLQPGIPAPFQPTQVTRGRFNYLSYPESDRQAVVNRYDNALHYVDEQIGKLERTLDRLGLLEDTIWIITADHGENFHDHQQVTHGKTLYDTEARVPLLVHWPAKLAPADIDEPVSNMDILPTLLDLLELPAHPAFQGRSFANAKDRGRKPESIFMNIQGLKSAEAVICWPWKLILDRGDHSLHLYDLEQDPREIDDRVERDVEIAETLRATLSSQIAAQMQFHKRDNPALTERFAPRLLTCPSLPRVERVSASPEHPPAKRAAERHN